MDFGALPPEINSARMYSGPGASPLLAAAAAWDEMAANLQATAASYSSVISGLGVQWTGPSYAAMTAATAPYTTWMNTTAAQAEQAATQARAAAAAYEAAFAMTVPPPVIEANRALLMSLVATNLLGQNTPAILATEAHYAQMWAQDATAMYGYAANSAAATTLTPFTAPQQVANPAAAVDKGVGTSMDAGTQSALSQLVSTMPQTLSGLAAPGADPGTASGSSSLGSLSSLSSLTMPLRMAMMPMSMLMRMLMQGSSTGAKTMGAGVGAAASTVAASTAANALGSTALTGLGVGSVAPVSVGLGQAGTVGWMSVPQTWTAATSAVHPVSAALPSATAPAVSAAEAAGGVPPVMPLSNSAVRGVGGATLDTRFLLRPNMLPRSPVA